MPLQLAQKCRASSTIESPARERATVGTSSVNLGFKPALLKPKDRYHDDCRWFESDQMDLMPCRFLSTHDFLEMDIGRHRKSDALNAYRYGTKLNNQRTKRKLYALFSYLTTVSYYMGQ